MKLIKNLYKLNDILIYCSILILISSSFIGGILKNKRSNNNVNNVIETFITMGGYLKKYNEKIAKEGSNVILSQKKNNKNMAQIEIVPILSNSNENTTLTMNKNEFNENSINLIGTSVGTSAEGTSAEGTSIGTSISNIE